MAILSKNDDENWSNRFEKMDLNNFSMQDIQAFGDISRETLDRSDDIAYSAKSEVGLSE
jgi:hypothetical protein